MAKINIVEDENAVLFTGYNKEEVRRLGVDACNCAVQQYSLWRQLDK